MPQETKLSLIGIEKTLADLPSKMEDLGRFIINNPSQVAFMTIKQLASAAGVSEATVTRFVVHFGYNGYADFLSELRGRISDQLPANVPSLPDGPWGDKIRDELRRTSDILARLPDEEVLTELIQLLPAAARIHIVHCPPAAPIAAKLFWELSRIRTGLSLSTDSLLKEEEEITGLPEGSLIIALIKNYSTVEMGRLLKLIQTKGLPLFIISDNPAGVMGEYSNRYLSLSQGMLDLDFTLLISYLIEKAGVACKLRYHDHQARLDQLALDHQPVTERLDTLQLVVSHDIRSLDPSAMHGHMREGAVMRCIFQGLVKFEEGGWNIVPELATHWQEAEDGLSVIFYLRQGVHFHQNYGELTADDVKYSFENIASSDSSLSGHSTWKVLEEVVVLSRYVVKLVLKYPCPHLFTGILPLSTGMIASKRAIERISRSQFAFNPIGTGPYEIKSFRPRDQIELEAFKGFWGEPPQIRRLIFRLDTHVFNVRHKFNSGGLDVAVLPNLNPEMIKGVANLTHERAADFYQYWWLGMIVDKPPFNHINVRKAVRLALDQENIRASGLFGARPLRTPIPESVKGHWAEAPHFEYSPDKARELVAAAGLKLDMPVILAADPSEIDIVALEIIKGNLSDIGFNIQLDLVNRFVLLEKIRTRECHLYLDFFAAFADAYLSLGWFTKNQFFNLSHWDNEEYNRIVELIERELDEKRRLELIVEAQKLIIEDCWAVWLAENRYSIVYKNYVDIGLPFPDGLLTPWTMSKNLYGTLK